jgi:hypothetical protein
MTNPADAPGFGMGLNDPTAVLHDAAPAMLSHVKVTVTVPPGATTDGEAVTVAPLSAWAGDIASADSATLRTAAPLALPLIPMASQSPLRAPTVSAAGDVMRQGSAYTPLFEPNGGMNVPLRCAEAVGGCMSVFVESFAEAIVAEDVQPVGPVGIREGWRDCAQRRGLVESLVGPVFDDKERCADKPNTTLECPDKNLLGRYSFELPELCGGMRSLRDPDAADEE